VVLVAIVGAWVHRIAAIRGVGIAEIVKIFPAVNQSLRQVTQK
jgi:hypothetical protein